ncbi:hypothetical protein HK097_003716 [Rhizophlyctis rosea]|uniref:t-SNARE coiled-coil homology domain-containing protein n=1 Tax=Rhizophlyctis rosea TaxID=64517 RepID=A0AAD5SML1_9FUNG|nr:hypothetical protein HK097_003716 [Rhizophlyctis rosea]
MQATRKGAHPFGGEVRPSISEPPAEDDLDALISETLKTQEASASSTARSVAVARQTEQLAAENMVRLNSQGEQLDRVASQLDTASHHVATAEAKTDYLSKLTRNFLIPVFGKERDTSKHSSDTLGDAYRSTSSTPSPTSSPKLGPDGRPLWGRRTSSLPEGGFSEGGAAGGGGGGSGTPAAGMVGTYASAEQQDRSAAYEQQIESDLNQISGALSNLKQMNLATSAELDRQKHVGRVIEDKVEENHSGIQRVNRKVEKILRK